MFASINGRAIGSSCGGTCSNVPSKRFSQIILQESNNIASYPEEENKENVPPCPPKGSKIAPSADCYEACTSPRQTNFDINEFCAIFFISEIISAQKLE